MDDVTHQRVQRERGPVESFQGIVLKYLGRIFYFFSTKMNSMSKAWTPSCVGMWSNIKIMTLGEL